MKITNQPKLQQDLRLLQVTIGAALVLGILAFAIFFGWGVFSPKQSLAANTTISAGSTVWASSDPFSTMTSGDTLFIQGKFNLDQDYDLLRNEDIVIIIDGSNAELKLYYGMKLKLGGGSLIYTENGGKIKMQGKCDSTTAIHMDTIMVANCDGSGATSFSDFNNGGDPLPVEWLDVTATSLTSTEVEVNWQTASEVNNSHFDVQFSTDNTNWETIQTITSHAPGGNSTEILSYSALHQLTKPITEGYYRIKQTDFDGIYDHSKTVVVEFEKNHRVNVATLGDSKIRVNVDTETNMPSRIKIYDEKGALIVDEQFNASKLFNLPKAGLYILEVETGQDIQRIKHMVK